MKKTIPIHETKVKKLKSKCTKFKNQVSIHLSKQFDNNNIIMLLWKKISKDDLVLTCGVAFLEI
jgi:hypothetical protein